MGKAFVVMALVALALSGAAQADDQLNQEIKKSANQVRTLSVVKDGKEFVYEVPEAMAAALPKGDQKNLSAEQKNALEDAIQAITKGKEPVRVAAIVKDEKEAKTASWRWRQWHCFNFPSYHQPQFYYGGGFYYSSGFPTCANTYHQPQFYYGGGFYYSSGSPTCANTWNYYGYYSYNNFGGCYWGW